MPLLGRHKSLPGSSRATQISASDPADQRTSSSTNTQQQQQQQTTQQVTSSMAPSTTPQQSRYVPAICESPLFGIRRQLPVALHTTHLAEQVSSTSNQRQVPIGSRAQLANSNQKLQSFSTQPTAKSSSRQSDQNDINNNNSNSDSISSTSFNTSSSNPSNMVCIGDELSSIPQYITRQQIHYAFTIMDNNSDGLINVHDLSQMLANLGVPIDEAILSHVMSIASKRGDRRMTEVEFLDWLSNFIQISDSPTPESSSSSASAQLAQAKSATTNKPSTGNRRLRRTPPLGRSATTIGQMQSASLSVALDDKEAAAAVGGAPQLAQRRGSGSGLALMRSLSAAAAAAAASVGGGGAGAGRPMSTESGAAEACLDAGSDVAEACANAPADQAMADLAEARSDLRAAFCVFDLDGDGYITLDEVRAGLGLLGEQWSASELAALFNRCNGNTGNNRDLSTQQQQSKRAQRISIDDFVQLLL